MAKIIRKFLEAVKTGIEEETKFRASLTQEERLWLNKLQAEHNLW